MPNYDIEIFDTREDVLGVVRNVPADTVQEACKKVAEKKGWVWIGPAKQYPNDPCGYALNPEVWREWNDEEVRNGELFNRTELELERLMESEIQDVKDGKMDEFRGLYSLYEHEPRATEDFAD